MWVVLVGDDLVTAEVYGSFLTQTDALAFATEVVVGPFYVFQLFHTDLYEAGEN